MFKKFVNKFVAVGISTAIMTGLVCNTPAYAINYSSSIGTSAGLGSPLINDASWNSDQWNPWEEICFGVFCSNFPIPFVDDYMTAFQQGHGGSGGRGLKALKFGTSNDAQSEKILKSLLSFTITEQSKTLTPIKVVWHDIDVNNGFADTVNGKEASLWKDEDGKTAQVKNLFVGDGTDDVLVKTNNANITARWGDAVYDTGGVQAQDSELRAYFATEMKLPELYINNGGTTKTVYDYRDGFDIQTFAALLSAFSSDSIYGKKVINNIDSSLDNELLLDSYGNIVTVIDNRPVIVIPACNNQHITKENTYNFLTASYMQDRYITSSGESLISSLRAKQNVDCFPLGGILINTVKNKEDAGKIIAYNDTDAIIYNKAKELIKSGSNADDAVQTVIDSEYKSIGYGLAVSNLVNKKIGTDNLNGVNLRIEPTASIDDYSTLTTWLTGSYTASGATQSGDLAGVFRFTDSDSVVSTVLGASYVADWFPINSSRKILNYMFTSTGKAQMLGGRNGKDVTYLIGGSSNVDLNRYLNYALKYADTSNKYDIAGGDIPTQDGFLGCIKKANTISGVESAIFTHMSNSGTASFTDADMTGGVDQGWTDGAVSSGLYQHWYETESGLANNKKKSTITDSTNLNRSLFRLSGIYTLNSNMQAAINVLGVKEGTEFASFTPWIYLSYLDFYGIMEDKSNFDEAYFKNSDVLNTKAEDLFEGVVLGEEEKKAAITDMTYKLLDPESGNQYRKELTTNMLTEWLYSTYNKIVFGTDELSSSQVSTTNQNGFLAIHTVSENFFLGLLENLYNTNILIAAAIILFITLLMSIIRGNGLFKTTGGVVGVLAIVLLAPVCIDIVPYLCNNSAQSIFEKHSSYWAVNQDIENQSIDAGDTEEDALETASFIRSLNIAQLDRTIFIKNDISSKIVESIDGIDYAQLQKLRTARWLLPTLIRQINTTGEYSYLSSPLGDVYQKCLTIYWYYRNSNSGDNHVSADMLANDGFDASLIKKIESGTSMGGTSDGDVLEDANKFNCYAGYKSTNAVLESNDTSDTINYPRSRIEPETANIHTYFYLIGNQGLHIPDPKKVTNSSELTLDTWDKYAEYVRANLTNSSATRFKTLVNDEIIPHISDYNSYQDPMQQYYGYLWSTENVIPYFYTEVKDQFDLSYSLGKIMYELQGKVGPVYVHDDNGGVTQELYVDRNGQVMENVHKTFMRDNTNGQLKDFLDMRELFTNVIPYLYNMQVYAGGNDDGNGVLGDGTLGDSYSIYKDNKKYWLFRCNWVTKIIESRYYNGKQTIGYIDANGNHAVAIINGGVDPSCYEGYREMIFSESQMEKMGLTEADLSAVEASILKVNKATAEDWVMMLNFANTKNMTAENLYRQMAIEATMNFNKEFSGGNGLTSKLSLYPTTLDLRNISFDAVMKLIVLSSNNSSFITSANTIKTVIQSSSLFASFILLADAWLCNTIVPLIRDICIALLTYLLIWQILWATIMNTEGKHKLVIGAALQLIAFGLITMVYYVVFRLVITSTAPNEVLHKATLFNNGRSGSTWAYFLIILLDSAFCIFATVKLIIFTVKNRHDMGFEASMSVVSSISKKAGSMVTGIKGVGNKLGYGANYALRGKEFANQREQARLEAEAKAKAEADGEGTKKRGRKPKNSSGTNEVEKASSGYINTEKLSDKTSNVSADIDKKISEGKKKQADESKKKANKE